jgi:hypothetical protein
MIGSGDQFAWRNLLGGFVGDVEEVLVFGEQQLLPAGDIDFLTHHDHAVKTVCIGPDGNRTRRRIPLEASDFHSP